MSEEEIEQIKAKVIEIQKHLDELKVLVEKLQVKRCFLCNEPGHLAKDCIDSQPVTEDDRDFSDVYEDDTDDEDEYYSRFFCYRCGRKGHYSVQCREMTHVNGDDLDDYTDQYHSE